MTNQPGFRRGAFLPACLSSRLDSLSPARSTSAGTAQRPSVKEGPGDSRPAKAGLLEGRKATTHWAALDLLESLGTGAIVEREPRVVDDVIITSAGVASGIDMAFYVVERLCGREVADETARYIEYRR